jgi:hypothetical protein
MPQGINIHDLHRKTLKPAASFVKDLCESGLYQVEIYGNPVMIKRVRELISNKFTEPKDTPAHMQRGKIHVRAKRPINQHAGDMFFGQFEAEVLF